MLDRTGVLVAVIGAIGAGAAAIVTWLVARRQTSGSVATSDASQLWQEGQSIRADMRTEIVGLRTELLATRGELAAARGETADLRVELAAARSETRALRSELVQLRARLAKSEGRIDQIEEDAHGG